MPPAIIVYFDSLRGAPPLTIRARCGGSRYFPNPLGIGIVLNDRLAEESLPLGEGAERSEADEGQYSTDCKKNLIVRLNSYPHQSKIRDF